MLKPDVRLTEEVERHFRDEDMYKCCSECLLPSDDLKRCAQCKEVQYCSKPCQKKAWTSGHKVSCGKIALREIPGQVKFESLLGFILIYIFAHFGVSETIALFIHKLKYFSV